MFIGNIFIGMFIDNMFIGNMFIGNMFAILWIIKFSNFRILKCLSNHIDRSCYKTTWIFGSWILVALIKCLVLEHFFFLFCPTHTYILLVWPGTSSSFVLHETMFNKHCVYIYSLNNSIASIYGHCWLASFKSLALLDDLLTISHYIVLFYSLLCGYIGQYVQRKLLLFLVYFFFFWKIL